MKLFQRISTGLSVLIFVVCCLAFLLFGVSKTGWKVLDVPTGSMRPSIQPNALLVVHGVPVSSLKVGDVITYIDPLNSKVTISHRIVKEYLIGGVVPGFVTKGDANKVADPPIAGGNVVGKVVWQIPDAGKLLVWSKTWLGVAALVYLPAALLMAEEVKRLAGYFKSLEPYRLWGFRYVQARAHYGRRAASVFGVVLVTAGFAFWQPALALLRSNTVTLADNRLSVAANSCSSGSTKSKTNVTVNNVSSQTAQSGSATSGSGSATSGNASNTNTTTTTITVKNGC